MAKINDNFKIKHQWQYQSQKNQFKYHRKVVKNNSDINVT